MKIIAIGYYDDFARFFLSIKKEFLKENPKSEFKYLSLYLSGYLYFLSKLQKVSFFSFKVWLHALVNNNKYNKLLKTGCKTHKDIDLDKVIKYHLCLVPNLEVKLKKQAIAYINVIENFLEIEKPNIIVLSGDSRMSVEIFSILAKRRNIKIYYFEQGPFGTTILDEQGVNANASIRNKRFNQLVDNIEEKQLQVEAFFKRKKGVKYKRSPIFRGSDYFFELLFSKFNIIPPDLFIGKIKKVNANNYKNLSKVWVNGKNYFLLVLQVPFDVNMVYHSPYYNNHFSIVKDVYTNLPANSQLIVREHPLFKGKYELDLYKFMKENNITIDTKNLYQAIDDCHVTIVNNSTVGIEAVSRLKPVVALGNSYYDNEDICIKLKNKNNLKKILFEALTHNVNKDNVFNFLSFFTKFFLIDGHFRDEKLISSKKIVERIRY